MNAMITKMINVTGEVSNEITGKMNEDTTQITMRTTITTPKSI